MKILIKYPIRERPEKFFQTLDKYYSFADDIENIRFIITIDSDDITMNNKGVLSKLDTYPNLQYFIGNSKTKIEAINADIVDLDWDILLLASDDMVPVIKGYDTDIRQQMKLNYPDTDGVLWFFDGHRKDLNTLCILGREYYKRFNYIYYPGFITWYADNYFQELAQKLNKQTFINRCIIEHQHYIWMHKKPDKLAIKEDNPKLIRQDKKLYESLKLNYGMEYEYKLSILICHLAKRAAELQRLKDILNKQNLSGVEILICKDNGSYTVGAKREHLLNIAKGKYLCFIDDDDLVSENYISLLMEGIDKDVDCCSLTGIYTLNGGNPRKFIHSIKYDHWYGENNILYRPPNHLNCIKSDIAKRFHFQDIKWGEDQAWSMEICNAKILKTEHVIEKPIYSYLCKDKK